ncbi:MAG TPA: bifunctional DNA-formamidopyrimidine glycosylase/DNA-(apurinic or apyrimidinic site) lyase [Gemmatimonadales bacterium]|nr:bifunctional DNA-formamidopyrimidine glycosylase/DNA-(apurinic or apyrimidinic site) lyase [Gemmatimonadales bacterium]
MPELPEVETIARDVRPHLVGAAIRAVRVAKPDVLRGIGRRAFERSLTGRRFTAVARRAKHLVLVLDDGHRLVIQPRMTGSLLVTPASAAADRYVVILASLSTGRSLAYRDVRRLGAVHLLSAAQWARYTARIGPEPLERGFTAARLLGLLAGGRLAVKKALMDQRRLAGVGNIYANEALWGAGIDPSRAARTVTAAEARRLHRHLLAILRRSIRRRGTTVRDYRTGTGERGAYQSRLAVYGRAGRPCRRCGRRIVLTHAVDARATYFCPGCQR